MNHNNSSANETTGVYFVIQRIDPEALYTCAELGALLRVHPKTVAKWARSGRITARGPQKKPLFWGQDVLQITWTPRGRRDD